MHFDRSKWMCHFSNVEQGWGFRILQMFQIQKKTVTSLQRTVKINPQSHTPATGKEKNGPCLHSPVARFLTNTWGKVEKYVTLCSHYVACFLMCFMFVCMDCMCKMCCRPNFCCIYIFSDLWRVCVCVCITCYICVYNKNCICVWEWIVQRVCFLHFLSLSCILYSVSSPLSVCPLGQCLWISAMKRPLSGSSGVCWKIPTWTQQTLQFHENSASG